MSSTDVPRWKAVPPEDPDDAWEMYSQYRQIVDRKDRERYSRLFAEFPPDDPAIQTLVAGAFLETPEQFKKDWLTDSEKDRRRCWEMCNQVLYLEELDAKFIPPKRDSPDPG